jgi:hypothetical protein
LKLGGGAVLAIALIFAGGLWWGTRLTPDPNLVAVGAAAPAVTLLDPAGQPVALEALRGTGPLVLVFFRGHW